MDNPFRAFRIPLVIGCFRAKQDRAAFGCVFVRIAHEICKYLPDAQTICPNFRQIRYKMKLNALTLIFHLSFRGSQNFIDNFAYSTGLKSRRRRFASIFALSLRSETSADMRSTLERMVLRKLDCISLI